MQLRETVQEGKFSCSVVYSDADENSVIADIKGGFGRFFSVIFG